MNNSFDSHNSRVKKAHQKRALNTPLILILNFIIFIALLGGGIVSLFFKYSFGWTLIGFSVIPLMMVFWIKSDLAEIPVKQSDNLTDLLSENLLLLLNEKTVPTDLVNILPKTPGGMFIMARANL